MEKCIFVNRAGQPQAGESLRIIAGKNWTVHDLKIHLQTLARIRVQDQLLIVNNNKTLLLDDSAKVKTLHSWATEPMSLTVCSKINPPKKVSLLIYVRSLTYNCWSSISVEVDSSDSVQQLRMRIDEVKGIPPCRQELVVILVQPDQDPVRVPMMDMYKLEDVIPSDIDHHIVLIKQNRPHRSRVSVKVVVSSDEEDFFEQFWMDLAHDTVNTLLIEISGRKGFVLPGQKFTLRTEEQELVHGAFTLSHYGVKANDSIYLTKF